MRNSTDAIASKNWILNNLKSDRNDLMLFSCVPGWKSVNGKGYNIFLLIFAFFIPLLIMIFCSVSKYRHLKKVKNLKANFRRKALKSLYFTNVFLRRLSTRSPMKRLHVAQLKGIKRASEWYEVHFLFSFSHSQQCFRFCSFMAPFSSAGRRMPC